MDTTLRRRSLLRAKRNRILRGEQLEDRSLLATVGYQVHLLPPGGAITDPDLTTVNVGETYDLAVTVQDLRADPGANPGVYAGYLDIGYDQSKTHVEQAEIQRIAIGPLGTPSAVSGSFRLTFDGQTTTDIPYSPSAATLAASIKSALESLSKVGTGNLSVRSVGTPTSFAFQVRFGGKFDGLDAANLTVASQSLTGGSNPTVSVSYPLDLAGGTNAATFLNAFTYFANNNYFNGPSAINSPNVLDEVGAFSSGSFAGGSTSPTELVRTRLVATAGGTVTFTPSVANIVSPGHDTLLLNQVGAVLTAEIDVGPARTLTIVGNSSAPITANADAATMTAGVFAATIDVLANDTTSPASGQSTSVVSVTSPGHGSATIVSNKVVYQPTVGYVGVDTFTYTARNTSAGAQSATSTASVTITINPVTSALMRYQVRIVPVNGALFMPNPLDSHALIPTQDLTSVSLGDTYDLVVTAQAADPAGLGVYAGYLDISYDSSKTWVAAADPQTGSISDAAFLDTFKPRGVQLITTIPGSDKYYPFGVAAGNKPNLIDDVGAFSDRVFNNFPGQRTSAEVAAGITVAPPRELIRATFRAVVSGTVTFAPDLANVSHPAHDSLLYGFNDQIPPSQIDIGVPRTLTIGATPISATNDAATLLVNAAATPLDVLANDLTTPAAGQTKNVVAVTQGAHGTVSFTATGVTYQPVASFVGTDTFTYTARNITAGPTSATSTATVTITIGAPITAINDAVILAGGTVSTAIDVLGNDVTTPSSGQAKSIVSVTSPVNGSATIAENKIVYQPVAGFSGNDTFTYTARNTTAGASSATSTATVTVTVSAVTSALMRYQVRVVPVGGALFMPDQGNSSALVPTPDLTAVRQGDTYDLVVTVQATDPASLGVFAGYLDIRYDSSKTWVAAADPVTGGISDAAFVNAFRPHSVQLVTNIPGSENYYPNGVAAGNKPNLIDDLGAFSDRIDTNFPGQRTSAETAAGIAAAPPRELVRATFRAVASGQVTFAPDLTEILHPQFDTLIYGLNDPIPLDKIDIGTPRTITIAAGYSAVADSATVFEDSAPSVIDVLANDVVGAGQTKQIVSFKQGAHGTVAAVAGGLEYRPDANYFGTDTFTYQAAVSGSGEPASGTVTVNVLPVNDRPTFSATTFGDPVLEDANTLTIAQLQDISPGPGEPETVVFTAVSDNPDLTGPISVNYVSGSATGTVTYKPAANRSGTARVTLIARDTGDPPQESDTVILDITVLAVNDAPQFVAGANQAAKDEDGAISVTWATDVSRGAAQESSQQLSFEVENNNHDLFTVQPKIDASGNLTYTPKLNATGSATVSVVLRDDGGTANGGVNASPTKFFTIDISKTRPLHNAAIPEDCSGDNAIAPNDALNVINYINENGRGKIPEVPTPELAYLDVTGDGFIAPDDPLMVINYINSHPKTPPSSGGGAGEGALAAPDVDAAVTTGGPVDATTGNLSNLIAQLAFDAAEQASRRRPRIA